MKQRHKRSLQWLSAFVLSGLLHLLALGFVPFHFPQNPRKKIRYARVIHLTPRRLLLPKLRQQVVRIRSRRSVRRLRPRPRVRRKRRPRRRKKRVYRRKRRLAQLVPRPSRFHKLRRRSLPRQRIPPPSRPRERSARRDIDPALRRFYRSLNLRPRLPLRPSGVRSRRDKAKGSKAKGLVPWAGKSHFARMMRAYHQRWLEDMRDRRGLVDAFFGKVSISMDRCMEAWFQRNLTKHLKPKEIFRWFVLKNGRPTRLPQWRGVFTMSRASTTRRWTIRLKRSWGAHRLDRLFLQTAQRCAKRIVLPQRLRGKRIWIKVATQAIAYYRLHPKYLLLPFDEVRNPQTGGIEIKFTPIGSIQVSSHSMILRQRY